MYDRRNGDAGMMKEACDKSSLRRLLFQNPAKVGENPRYYKIRNTVVNQFSMIML
jgi:hypothetical protein